MAGPNIYIARVASVALAASTTKTFVQVVAPSTRQLLIKEFGFSFDGIDATKIPAACDALRQTTAGTSSALTLVQGDPSQTAPLSSALQTFSAEPTASDIVWSEFITPAGGYDRWIANPGEEIVIAASGRFGLRVTSSSTWTACNVTAYIRYSEV